MTYPTSSRGSAKEPSRQQQPPSSPSEGATSGERWRRPGPPAMPQNVLSRRLGSKMPNGLPRSSEPSMSPLPSPPLPLVKLHLEDLSPEEIEQLKERGIPLGPVTLRPGQPLELRAKVVGGEIVVHQEVKPKKAPPPLQDAELRSLAAALRVEWDKGLEMQETRLWKYLATWPASKIHRLEYLLARWSEQTLASNERQELAALLEDANALLSSSASTCSEPAPSTAKPSTVK